MHMLVSTASKKIIIVLIIFWLSHSSRVLCKFFAHGACLKGDHCEFSHDWKDPSNNVCTFYQKGTCSYGSRCRYEHVKVSPPQPSAPSSSAYPCQYLSSDSVRATCPSRAEPFTVVPVSCVARSSSAYPCQYLSSDSVHAACPSRAEPFTVVPVQCVTAELSASSRPFFPPTKQAWISKPGHHDVPDNGNGGESNSGNPADLAICSFAAAGDCPRGEKCPHIHGDLCPTCGKHCLHPFRPEERDEHTETCAKKQKHLESLKHSQEIECSVCLERVLSKPTTAERKFGLLSECDHPFCVSCIRNWRSSSPTSGMDVNSALRACPICRKLSYFVIPSVIWYSTREEKQEIVDNYKAKLKSIDCKHFDFGNGTCPFGTSCFYKGSRGYGSPLVVRLLGTVLASLVLHAYRDGRLEEVVLRHIGAEDGQTVIAKNIRLSDFLGSLHLR
ncbi:hypothetical protein RJ639_047089 [Escallonia herrerae]|uniref:RING-type E3 ubiquitin transferase n=1 Tax=Escallonia herrerae TaxID=1293975 RepID=A0AA89AZV6_9ASTE|nr:hypothetical protein RJ639_047089 [Escallonia herrerae]